MVQLYKILRIILLKMLKKQADKFNPSLKVYEVIVSADTKISTILGKIKKKLGFKSTSVDSNILNIN
tara:strand:- start:278 stop:478 length:201 start_codon:yes stop_codon:yes gene_type:complete